MEEDRPPSVYTCSEVTAACPVEHSIYGYYPSVNANVFFLALFLLLLFGQLWLGVSYRTWAYMVAMALGCLVEAIGYVGRLILHQNPYSSSGFKTQICCLIMGPAAFAMAIYLTLKHLVISFGRNYSYLKPHNYTRLFIACNVISVILQGVGAGLASAGLASAAGSRPRRLSVGDNITMCGLVFQVFTLVLFAGLTGLYFWRRRTQRKGALDIVPDNLKQLRFKFFVRAVALAFVTILIRCVYRVVEMIGGWGNPLMRNETEFVILDSTMCAIAAIALTLFHPGYCFQQMAAPSSNREQMRSDDERLTTLELHDKDQTRDKL